MYKGNQIVHTFGSAGDPGDKELLGFKDANINNQQKRIREFVRFSFGENAKEEARLVCGSREEGFFFLSIWDKHNEHEKPIPRSIYIPDFKRQTSVYGIMMKMSNNGDVFMEHRFYNSNRKAIRIKDTEVVRWSAVKDINGGPIAQMLYAAKRHERSFVGKRIIDIFLEFIYWQRKEWYKTEDTDIGLRFMYRKSMSEISYVNIIKKIQSVNGRDCFMAHVSLPRGRHKDFTILYFIDDEEFLIQNIK